MSFYNTTQESGQQLIDFRAAARTQEEKVLQWFRSHPGKLYSPSMIQKAVMPEAPITSARRAITNLTEQGLLEKSGKKRVGVYGRPESGWMLATAVSHAA